MRFITRLIMKSITFSLVVTIVSMLPQFRFDSALHPVIIGTALAIIGCIVELLLLRAKTMWLVTALDFVIAAGFVYLSQDWFPGAKITTMGTIVNATAIAVLEHMHHLFLTRGWNPGKRRKPRPKPNN